MKPRTAWFCVRALHSRKMFGSSPAAIAVSARTRCVMAVVRAVPAGKVTTYGAVAAVAGGCARSVGAVMRKNCPPETRVP